MAGAVGVLVLVTVLVIAAKGLPLFARELEGRRLEQAVRAGDGESLRRAVGAEAGAAQLRRVLHPLRTAELLALGDRMLAAADEERGVLVLEVIAEVVERRQQVLARWERLRESRRADEAGPSRPSDHDGTSRGPLSSQDQEHPERSKCPERSEPAEARDAAEVPEHREHREDRERPDHPEHAEEVEPSEIRDVCQRSERSERQESSEHPEPSELRNASELPDDPAFPEAPQPRSFPAT